MKVWRLDNKRNNEKGTMQKGTMQKGTTRKKMSDKRMTTAMNSIMVVVIVFFVAFCVRFYTSQEYPIYEYTDFTHERILEEGTRQIEIPLSGLIDESRSPYDVLIRTSQQTLRLIINGEVIYDYQIEDNQRFIKAPPSKWHVIDFALEEYEEVLTIEYSTPYEGFQEVKPQIYYGTGENLVANVTRQTFPNCLLSWIAIIMGVLTIFICISIRRSNVLYVAHLGMFLLAFGMWSWGESKSMLFNYTDLYWQSQITLVMVGLMGIPLFQYVKRYVTNSAKKLINMYISCSYILMLILICLTIGRVADLMELLPIIHAQLGIGVILLAGIYIKRIVQYCMHPKHTKERNVSKRDLISGVAIMILVAATICEILNMYYGSLLATGFYIRIGVMLYITSVYVLEIIAIREETEKASALQKELDQANIHIMTDKMKPHFIHNTLLAIQELCYSDPEQASDAIGVFSRYLRGNLEGKDYKDLIPFAKELEYVELYMNIQQMCYEDAIQFKKDIQVKDFKVPPFTIQPIVENAVVHGIRKVRYLGVIELNTYMEEDYIVIQVRDNGSGYQMKRVNTSEFSSSEIIEHRIRELLDGKMEITSRANQGTEVKLYIRRS